MGKNAGRFLILTVVILAGVAMWQYHRAGREQARREKAELDTGLAASRVLTAVLSQQAVLRVAALDGKIVSRGECRSGYFFPNQQNTVAPYSVGYSVDLRRIDRSDYRWDARRRVMVVDVPPISVEPPNIDLSRARSVQSGVFVSRTCGLAMQQQVAGRLRVQAEQRAARADYMARARDWARAAIGDLVRTPLAAAGLADVDVQVRFPDERNRSIERWDQSRTPAEVIANQR